MDKRSDKITVTLKRNNFIWIEFRGVSCNINSDRGRNFVMLMSHHPIVVKDLRG